MPVLDNDRQIDVRPSHVCETKRKRVICCIDEYGKLFMHFTYCRYTTSFIGTEEFTYCSCEPLPITLTRANLWPASPSNPSYAFSFGLLDWAEALLFECQVSLNDFCHALKFRCPFDISQVSIHVLVVLIGGILFIL